MVLDFAVMYPHENVNVFVDSRRRDDNRKADILMLPIRRLTSVYVVKMKM